MMNLYDGTNLTIEQIVKEYSDLEDIILKKLLKEPNDPNLHVARIKQEELRKIYVSKLPENKRLAIHLHTCTCHANHIDGCSFYYEMHGIEDDWTGYEHRCYLEKADKLLEIEPDEIKLESILSCI